MFATKQNLKIADEIVQILIREKCTIKAAQSILSEVSKGIEASSMVQMEESYQERFKNALEWQDDGCF